MKNYLKVLSLFSTMGIATIGIIATTYTSIVLKNDTNSSKKIGSKNYSYKKDLISEEQFSKKIDEEKKFLEQSFKNTTKPNSWKIFRRTKIISIPQSLSHKSEVDLKKEFKTGNLKIRALLYVQETPSSWNKEQNKNYYSSQTKKWSDQIAKKLTNLLRIEQGSFSPFVNFIFKDFNDKEKNLDILQNEKRIKAIFSYENSEVKNAKPGAELATKKVNEQYNKKTTPKVLEKKSVFESIFKKAKLDTQLNNDRDNYDSLGEIKIGIVEIGWSKEKSTAFVDASLDTFKKTTVTKKTPSGKSSKHASLVAAIVAGKNGINIKAQIYSANQNNGVPAVMEWMINNGVKIVNHSYLYGSSVPYSEDAYYIDFVSRKYGIINVLCAGNDGGDENPKISGLQLSINSIVVGGLNPTHSWRANSSSFGIFNEGNKYLNKLPKPLVLTNYSGFDDSVVKGSSSRRGTSYSTPIVTGALSLIMRDFQNMDRPEEAMAIIAASSTKLYDPSLNENIWAGHGFNKNVGAGKLNFKNMKKAASYLSSYTIPKNSSGTIASKTLALKQGEKITASVAWLYNGGLQSNNPKPLVTSPNYSTELRKWKLKNKTPFWKQRKIGFNDLRNLGLFTNYDLKLKYYNPITRTWNQVAYSDSSYSNVELFRHQAMKCGTYKLEVVKISENNESYEGAPDDVVAVSYVKE